MCQILRCFGWGAEVLQRILTFILGLITCCCICIGIVVSISAGVSYGYNNSLAEWFAQRKADVTVFVRRGQFVDEPQVRAVGRRSGDDDDLFASNSSVDYQDIRLNDDSKPLIDVWKQAQDTRNYAEKLTKYSKLDANNENSFRKKGEESMETLSNDEVIMREFPSSIPSRTTLANIPQPRRYNKAPERPRYNPSAADVDDKNFYPAAIEESAETSKKFKQHIKQTNSDNNERRLITPPVRDRGRRIQEEAADVAADYYIDHQAAAIR